MQIPVGPDPEAARDRLAEHGVLLSGTLDRTVFRAVTHLDVGDDDIEQAIQRIPLALERVPV